MSDVSAQIPIAEVPAPIIRAKNVSLVVPDSMSTDAPSRTTSKNLLMNSYLGVQKRRNKTILKNLNFSIFSGSRLAILGANGAGKTSLLRLIAGNIDATGGDLTVQGTTHSLFNLQMGMHPLGTGRENIVLRGLQLGMSIKEIREKTEKAIEFTNLGDNINRRFSTYSAGMKLRLAVAITLMPNPDILVMDEWIGAGDKTFTTRLSNRLDEYVGGSSGLVIASHNMNLINRICTHGLLLDKGQQIAFGKVAEVIAIKKNLESELLRENNV